MMNRYIIDEEQIDRFCGCISSIEAEKIIDEIRSVPYNPQLERDKVLDKIGFRCKKLMHMASKEEVKNGDLIICVASLHELLIELRQEGKDGE